MLASLFQRLHIHHFHQEVGERGVSRAVLHIGPTLLPALQRVAHEDFRLFGRNTALLALYGRAQVDFLHAVVHAVAANQVDAEAVELLRGLGFGHAAFVYFVAQTGGFSTDFSHVAPVAGS